METNLNRYEKDLDRLIVEGNLLYYALIVEYYPEKDEIKKQFGKKYDDLKNKIGTFSEKYQTWYSESLECLRQILPSRIDDFVGYYKSQTKRKDLTYANYTISDCLQGLEVTAGLYGQKVVGPDAAISIFKQQLNIIKSLKRKFGSSLFEIRALVQADLFDSELDAARELNKKGFIRGAGAVAGVVLESHLSQVCDSHKIRITKKKPTINDFNQLLKDNEVIETPTWRFIQHLGDLRNLCDHNKKREPKKEEIEELINGVEKITKTLF